SLSPQALRDAARAVWCAAGSTARPRRSDPCLRAKPRVRRLRVSAGGCRGRCQRDWHRIPARADPRRAGTEPLACVARAVHRHQHPALAHDPQRPAERPGIAGGDAQLRMLWGLAGQGLVAAPLASAPRLYTDSLNKTIDMQTVRVSVLNNRVPGAVLAIEVGGAAVALGLLALYLAILGRGVTTVLLAAGLITLLLLVTFDLDRPTRGLITTPDTPLTSLRASMALPPAATGPSR